MKTFEKAKLDLREFILANKEEVAMDLDNMKNMSGGVDVNEYLNKISYEYSFDQLNYRKAHKLE